MTDETWEEPESIWDMRRRAPFHFEAKADNARFSAYVLAHASQDSIDSSKSKVGYNGNPSIALWEGFKREASIAVELMLKAIIAVMTKAPPPNSHDVYELWPKAGLPQLDDDGLYLLAVMTEVLYWSGRYAAPISDKKLARYQDRLEKHERTEQLGTLRIRRPVQLDWKEFDELYRMAARRFWELDPNNPSNHVA